MTATPAPRLDPLSTELRLRALEARVRGVPASALEPEPEVSPKPASTKTKGDATDSADAADDSDAPTLARRTEQLRAKLGGVADTSAPIRQFLDNYERYAPLLRTLPDEEAAEDTLDWDTKRALVLESRADLVAAERGLREIDVYNKRGVAGAENLEDIVELKPALGKEAARVGARHKDLEQTRADVAGLVGRYNEFTSTVSDMFLALHDQLSYLEEEVGRAERARRNEISRRY